jgi:hypothetical protein
MTSFRPFEDGDTCLWAINKLANAGKHKIVSPMALGVATFSLESLTVNGDISPYPAFPAWDKEKSELVVNVISKRGSRIYRGEIGACITFGEISALENTPAIDVFNYQLEKVGAILEALEKESVRLGLIPNL